MSFEGNYQMLCANGHLIEPDVFSKPKRCPHCAAEFVHTSIEDWTNGEDEEAGYGRGYGYIEFELVKPAVTKQCDGCHHIEIIEPAIYKLPTNTTGWEVREEEKCPRCNIESACEPHICPYQHDINGDDESTCTCCANCETECAMDI